MPVSKSPKRTSTRQNAVAKGYRSGLEDAVAGKLQAARVPYTYEEYRITYTVPERRSRYTPDFTLLDNGIIVETKGHFVTKDRQKHLLIKAQYPDLDIRFVFTRPGTRISKQSKTTYAMWCETHGFLYAGGSIPPEWLVEAATPERLAANAAYLEPVKPKASK